MRCCIFSRKLLSLLHYLAWQGFLACVDQACSYLALSGDQATPASFLARNPSFVRSLIKSRSISGIMASMVNTILLPIDPFRGNVPLTVWTSIPLSFASFMISKILRVEQPRWNGSVTITASPFSRKPKTSPNKT